MAYRHTLKGLLTGNGLFILLEMRDELPYCDTDVDTTTVLPGTWELRNNDTEVFVVLETSSIYLNFHIQSINDHDMELRLYSDPGSQLALEERYMLHK